MTIPTVSNNYAVATGTAPNDIAVPVIAQGAPTSYSIHYPLGKRWINVIGNEEYILTSITTQGNTYTANWQVSASPTGAISTLTGGSGGAISPSVGNINLLGTTNQITTTGSGSTITWALASTLVAPGSLEVTGLLKGDASATINTAGTALNLATDNDTAQVNIGTGTSGRTIDIGTSAAANLVTIGSTSGASALTLHAGSGNFVLSGAAATTTYTIGGQIDQGAITIGQSIDGQVLNLNVGYTTNVTTMATNIMTNGNGAAMTLNLLSGVASSTGTDTLNIMTGANTSSGGMAFNLLTNNSGTSIGTVSIATGTGAAHVINIGSSGAGNISVVSGSTIAITGTTNINTSGTAVTTIGNTTGNTAVTGSLTASTTIRGSTVYATGDASGVASTVGISNVNSTSVSTGTGTIKMTTGNNANSTAWIKIYIGATAYWIPCFTTDAP